MQNYTDEQLAELAQKGDKTAQEALLKRYQKMVRACSRKFFLHGGEPEDLVQEGMIGLTLAIGAYNAADGASFKNFAYRCVWCRIVDVVKAAANSKNEALNNWVQFSIGDKIMTVDPLQALMDEDERKELNELMSRVLTDMEFKIFTMYMDGVSYAEIRALTGKDYKSVDNAVQRSKHKLRKALAKNG